MDAAPRPVVLRADRVEAHVLVARRSRVEVVEAQGSACEQTVEVERVRRRDRFRRAGRRNGCRIRRGTRGGACCERDRRKRRKQGSRRNATGTSVTADQGGIAHGEEDIELERDPPSARWKQLISSASAGSNPSTVLCHVSLVVCPRSLDLSHLCSATRAQSLGSRAWHQFLGLSHSASAARLLRRRNERPLQRIDVVGRDVHARLVEHRRELIDLLGYAWKADVLLALATVS
jgi:hypothetical protein